MRLSPHPRNPARRLVGEATPETPPRPGWLGSLADFCAGEEERDCKETADPQVKRAERLRAGEAAAEQPDQKEYRNDETEDEQFDDVADVLPVWEEEEQADPTEAGQRDQ
jgi:hypothetical protein